MFDSNFQMVNALYNAMQSGGSPLTLINSLAQYNPQLKDVLIKLQNGANPQELFYSLCKEKGVDPSTILGKLNG